MGCCQNKPEQTEQKAGGCCGGGGHGHDHHGHDHHGHDHGAMKSEGKSCCNKSSAISGFFKKLFGGKKSGCCN